MDTLSEIINLLEDQKIKGVKYHDISPENLEFISNTKRPDGPSIQAEIKPHNPPVEKPKEIDKPIPAAQEQTPDTVQEKLTVSHPELAELVKSCQKCSFCHTSNHRLMGMGNLNADLMFIGDCPEKEDDESGQLITGPAGKLLTDIIKAMKFDIGQVYVTNTIKCSTQNKQLVNEEQNVHKCVPYLKREIELVNPKVIVLLGPVPLKYLLDKSPIGKCRGQWFSHQGIDCMPTYHPSYLLRLPTAKRDVWNDMQQVMHKLGINP